MRPLLLNEVIFFIQFEKLKNQLMSLDTTPRGAQRKKNPLNSLTKSPPYKIGQVAEWASSDLVHGQQKQLMGKTLKPMQQAIIACNINHDVLINLPTGYGKSMLYQFPASLLKRQTIIVFVPLRALLWDSVHEACLHGIDAAQPTDSVISAYFNKDKLPALMFLTPEKFFRNQSVQQFFTHLHANKLIFKFVIDEAHCVSQWGSDFRPDFLNVTAIRQYFPFVKILAMSATIPAEARVDLIQKMHMKGCYYFQASYNRPNLYYEIRQTKRKEVVDQIFKYIQERNLKNQCGIIYCQTIKLCSEVYDDLREVQKRSALFHSQVSEKDRKTIFDNFKSGQVKMMVSTICFGMGVNKRDIRYVINVGVSSSVENYYQQSGRAGRDGKKSYCLLLTYNRDDAGIIYLTEKSEAPKAIKKRKLMKIQTMKQYAASFECRKSVLFEMLGEKFSKKDCKGSCDICQKQLLAGMDGYDQCMTPIDGQNVDIVDFTQQAVKLAKNLSQHDKKFTKKQLNDYLRNKKNKKSDSIHFAPQFKGFLQRETEQFVDKLIYEMTQKGLLVNLNFTNGMGFLVKYLKPGAKKTINNFSGKVILRVKKPIISAGKDKKKISMNFSNYLDKRKIGQKNLDNQNKQFQQINESDYENETLVQGNILQYAHVSIDDDEDEQAYGQQEQKLIDQMIQQAKRKKEGGYQQTKQQKVKIKQIENQEDQIDRMIRQAKQKKQKQKQKKDNRIDQVAVEELSQEQFEKYIQKQKQRQQKRQQEQRAVKNPKEPAKVTKLDDIDMDQIERMIQQKKKQMKIKSNSTITKDDQIFSDQDVILIDDDLKALDKENPQRQYELGYSPFKKYQYVEGKPGSKSYQKNQKNLKFSKSVLDKLKQSSKKIEQNNARKAQVTAKLKRSPLPDFL